MSQIMTFLIKISPFLLFIFFVGGFGNKANFHQTHTFYLLKPNLIKKLRFYQIKRRCICDKRYLCIKIKKMHKRK